MPSGDQATASTGPVWSFERLQQGAGCGVPQADGFVCSGRGQQFAVAVPSHRGNVAGVAGERVQRLRGEIVPEDEFRGAQAGDDRLARRPQRRRHAGHDVLIILLARVGLRGGDGRVVEGKDLIGLWPVELEAAQQDRLRPSCAVVAPQRRARPPALAAHSTLPSGDQTAVNDGAGDRLQATLPLGIS